MRISEVAKRTGLNVSNVRFYERKGLLKPEREDENNYREYTEDDVTRIKEILLYRKMGISIESIYLLLNGQADRREVIERQLIELREQMENLQGSMDLCRIVVNEESITSEQIDYYLSYVHQEEEKGKGFAEVKELLEDIEDFTKDSLAYWRPWMVMLGRWPWIPRVVSAAFWLTVLAIPAVHVAEMIAGRTTLSIPVLVIYAFIIILFGRGFWKYRSNRDEDGGKL